MLVEDQSGAQYIELRGYKWMVQGEEKDRWKRRGKRERKT